MPRSRLALLFFVPCVLLGSLLLEASTPAPACAQNPFLQNRGKRTIESIRFEGNTKTRTYVLERELGFGVGDEYDPALVSVAQERLEALPFIAYVMVEADRTPSSVSLLFKVEEDTRFYWAPGLEYERRHGKAWIGQLRFGLSDLTGRGDSADLQLEFWRRRTARVTLANPWILGDLQLGVYTRLRVQEYDWIYEPIGERMFRDWGVEAGVWRDFDPWMRAVLSAGWRETQLHDDDGGPTLVAQDPFVQFALEHDSRDAEFYPTRGLDAHARVRFAGFGDDFVDSYSFTDLGASGFWSLPYVRTIGAHVGYRLTGDALPYYERTWLGGPMDVRGLRFGSIQGDEAFRATIELRRPVAVLPLREGRSIGLGAHVFHDWGKAWEHDESFGDREIRFSYGAGLHFNLNTSNFRFEWARDDDGEGHFVFEDTFTF